MHTRWEDLTPEQQKAAWTAHAANQPQAKHRNVLGWVSLVFALGSLVWLPALTIVAVIAGVVAEILWKTGGRGHNIPAISGVLVGVLSFLLFLAVN